MNSTRLKVLFVCSMNRQRSVTAERLYEDDSRVEARSAGIRFGATRRVNEADLKWADVVFVMEHDHWMWIATRFELSGLPPIEILEIPDTFEFMDPELQAILRSRVEARIEFRRRSVNDLSGEASLSERQADAKDL